MAKTTIPVVENKCALAFHQSILRGLAVAFTLFVGPSIPGAWSEESQKEPIDLTDADAESQDPHHRVDLGLDWFGDSDRSITTLNLGYTWAPGLQHSVNLNANIIDSELGGSPGDGDGLSDTVLQYSWAPGEKITARPWLPRRFGTGLGLLAPTGDLEKGTGAGMWVAAPFLGLPVVVGKALILLPSLVYLHSFSEEENSIPLQALSGKFGLVYGFAARWWVTFIPALTRDFELDETTIAASLQVGREVGSKHGVSLEIGASDDEITWVIIGLRSEFNWRVTLRGHLGFR